MKRSSEASASAASAPNPYDLAALFALAVAMYSPHLLQHPFFFADDFGLLSDADNLSSGATSFFDVPAWGVWRLGQRALWWVGYAIFGLDPRPYAIASVLLHAAVVVSVAVLLRRLGWGRLASAAAAVLFATLATPSFAVLYMVQSAVLVSALAVIWSWVAHDAGRPLAAASLLVVGALFYEQALCAVIGMAAINVWRRRKAHAGLGPPAAAAVLFVAANLWTLRHATKVFAYNSVGSDALRQIAFAPWLALGVPPAATMRASGAVLLTLATIAAVAAALRWTGARGVMLGLALAWTASLPYVGRNIPWWLGYYFYLPAVGAAAAFTAPRSRWWLLCGIPLVAWNLRAQSRIEKAVLDDMRRYEQVTRDTPVGRPRYAVLVNVNSGLAWAGWQFGGSLEAFELWDAPGAPARCFPAASLEEARRLMQQAFPSASRRGRWPEDRTPELRKARPPARAHLSPWPS